MEAEALIKLGQIAGIAGISLGIIFLIFKQIIAKTIFPNLTKDQGFKILRLIITFLFVIGLVGMILWSFNPAIARLANNTKAKNPFGEEQILLNDDNLFFSKSELGENDSKKTKKMDKYLFQIDIPNSDDYSSELITAPQYAEKFNKGASEDLGFKLFEDAHVFRIYRKDSLEIKTTNESYVGEKVSNKEYKEDWNYYMGIKEGDDSATPPNIKDIIDTAEINRLEKDSTKASKKELRHLKQLTQDSALLFNELAIVIFDKENYQKMTIASQGGRKIEPTPLNFLLSAGGTLPYIDILSVRQASVSKDNKIWGFYGQRKSNNVILDGNVEKTLYQDFYRIYTMNNSYIYQITLTYISSSKTPRTTWDDLVKSLQSLKIVY